MTKTSKKRPIPLPIQMVLGLVLGIVFGFLAPHFSQALAPVGTAFVQAIKMIVVPLVFTAITLGIYQMGNSAKQLGKVSVISLLYFFIATVVAIIIGLALNGMFHPGVGVNLSHTAELPKNINTTVNWTKFFLDMIPSNVFAAMSGTNLLPVLVFAVLLGLALASTGSRAKPLVDVLDALMGAVFKLTGWIIALSPIAIFAIIAWLFSTQGMHTILALLKLVLVMYLGLGVLLVLFAILMLCIGEQPLKTAKAVSEPVILAFATRSSEATLPLHMEKLVEMGVPKAVASVVLPLGYAFNRDGSIMYFALAVGFLADAYNIPLDPSTLLSIIVVTTLASKGSANVPSGGLVAIAMVLTTIGIPVEALAIIAGVDAFLDMGRTAVNVVSNTVAVKLVMRWAGIAYEPVEETAEV
ncbi:dicarboxylate/amino acid:cation symporter [Desulfovibrio desulfuricans]|nr:MULTISPECIES: dicarboxylate/amino acid:cation symporter [Desulfovibrio]MCB6541908.1 dicarboxylate/amino acid:cation symporter [Desulfovibrio desulfuricans]MCB6552989.1 dicarboxylate/amino acid:cation symporter [Desulfovibrio desulfuricans]MCB6564950.1 dicarboxylate/amino acid:cation symporter [Desulfovibrio desulfuricans]MCB7346101.1 dicarboxylate/amino acid:cation symporter [Desulfovibrio desulfuricans]MCQ4860714.1 dicarboxylate/amino acid:cation symporter [Desulfovibrio desulfuricans]